MTLNTVRASLRAVLTIEQRNSDYETVLGLPGSSLTIIMNSTVRVAGELSVVNLQLQFNLNTAKSAAKRLTRQTMCMTTEKCAMAHVGQ